MAQKLLRTTLKINLLVLRVLEKFDAYLSKHTAGQPGYEEFDKDADRVFKDLLAKRLPK